MSDSSRTQLFFLKESTFGQTPAAAMTEMRFAGESLGFNIENVTSNEIRSDRQTTDLIQVGAEAGGGVDFELSYGAYDDFFESALYDAFSTAISVSGATDISVVNADSSYNSTSTDFTAVNISVGQWIRVAGFTDANNNGFFRVVSITANKMVVEAGATTLADEAAGDSIDMDGSMLRNGTTRTSFSMEKLFEDETEYFNFVGMIVSQMNLNIAVNSILTGDFQFLGTGSDSGGTSIGTGAPNAAATADVVNAVGNIGRFLENDAVLDTGAFLQSMTVSVDNNLRGIDAVGTLGHVEVGAGRVLVTGEMQVYFKNDTIYQKYLNGTETKLSVRVTDADNNTYIISLPRVKFTTGEAPASGPDQDVILTLGYQAIRDATLDATIQIDRFAAP